MMADLDPTTPVLVGIATECGPASEPVAADLSAAPSAVEMMIAAARAAGVDSAGVDLGDCTYIAATVGTAAHENPAGAVADALGVTAHTVLADLGVLQTEVVGRAAEAIADGRADVALVVGGEAKRRAQRAEFAGVQLPEPPPASGPPSEHLRPPEAVISRLEIDLGLYQAVQQYAMIENAYRAKLGRTPVDHERALGELYAAFNRVAATNPEAAFAEPMDARAIATPGEGNRPLAYPYNKWHNSQWNVDQAAAVLLCSQGYADRHDIAADRRVYPHAIANSNHVVAMSERADLTSAAGFEEAARAAFAHAGAGPDDLVAAELYSCFPIAVELQRDALGLPAQLASTVTGGMAFAGGPFNNFVFQALGTLIARARAAVDGFVLSTAVSGLHTKQGVGLWSAAPPERGFAHLDVTTAVAARTESRPVVGAVEGPDGFGTVVSYTVVHDRSGPTGTVVLAELEDRSRVLYVDPSIWDTKREWVGETIALGGNDPTVEG